MLRTIALASAALALTVTATTAPASSGGDADVHLVPVSEIVVPIVDGDRLDGSLKLTIVLDAADQAAADEITESLPVLRPDLIAAAMEYSRLYASPLKAVDTEQLSKELTAAIRSQGPEVARVLIVEVAARPA